MAGGIESLLATPDQMTLLGANPDAAMATTVEELLRYVSPVVHMRRTATVDAELGGQKIAAGDKVVVFYAAANRDRSVWPDGDTLDVLRRSNHHLAFGGGGAHMCLGAHFARLETASLLEQVVTRMKGLRISGPVERLHSTFIAGPRHLPVEFDAAA